MTNISVDVLKAAINDQYGDDEIEFWNDVEYKGVTLDSLFGLTAKAVAQHGGEGQGDEYYVVAKIGTQHFMRTAFYSSWEGVYWDEGELFEVEPYEKTVTDYRRV